jgi:signal transduction histidine kinase
MTTRRTPTDAAVVAVAALFSLAYAGYFMTVRDVTDVGQIQALLEMTLFGLALVALVGSVWLALQTEAERRLQRRQLWWAVAGVVFLVVVNGWLMIIISPAPDFEDQLLQLLLSGGFGFSGGLLMGVLETQTIRQERARTRSEVRARKREEERQRLELLNQYLRHEILNKVQVVEMNTDIVLQRLDCSHPEYERLQTVAQRSEDIGRFVQSIRAILEASDHEPTLEPVDVAATFQSEAEKLERSFEATVTLDLPEQLLVEADSLLSTAVSNLLENAAEHGATEISVTAETSEDSVTLHVADDGPGIPPEARATLFDPPESGDHGYGLFLTRNLVELYGGRLKLAETGPDGTTLLLSLSRATESAETWSMTQVKAT